MGAQPKPNAMVDGYGGWWNSQFTMVDGGKYHEMVDGDGGLRWWMVDGDGGWWMGTMFHHVEA